MLVRVRDLREVTIRALDVIVRGIASDCGGGGAGAGASVRRRRVPLPLRGDDGRPDRNRGEVEHARPRFAYRSRASAGASASSARSSGSSIAPATRARDARGSGEGRGRWKHHHHPSASGDSSSAHQTRAGIGLIKLAPAAAGFGLRLGSFFLSTPPQDTRARRTRSGGIEMVLAKGKLPEDPRMDGDKIMPYTVNGDKTTPFKRPVRARHALARPAICVALFPVPELSLIHI